jgi:hypothetical protein
MILLQGYGRRLPSVLLSAIRQDFYAKPVAWSQPLFRSTRPRAASVSINEDAAPQNVDHMAINQAQRPFLQSRFPHPGLNPAGDRASLLSLGRRISCLVVDFALRRISTRRSTRQDAQINYLSTLSIFMKQTTYLATLPNPNLKGAW